MTRQQEIGRQLFDVKDVAFYQRLLLALHAEILMYLVRVVETHKHSSLESSKTSQYFWFYISY